MIHTAFDLSAEAPHVLDTQVIQTLLGALVGSGKVLVYTSGLTVLGNTGEVVVDEEAPLHPVAIIAWRPALEERVLEASGQGVRPVVIRPGWVYGRGGGVFHLLVDQARKDGIARPVGNGSNHWSVVHIEDLARLYVLATEQAPAGTFLHAVGGEPVAEAEIAGKLSEGLTDFALKGGNLHERMELDALMPGKAAPFLGQYQRKV